MRRRRSSAPCWTFRTWNTWRSDCWWTRRGGPPRWPGSGGRGIRRSWWTSTRTPIRCRIPFSRRCPRRGETFSWWGMSSSPSTVSVWPTPPFSWRNTVPSPPMTRPRRDRSGGLRCPKISAPAPRFWRQPTICFVPSCPGGWGRWTTQTGRPCTLAARFRRGRAMRPSSMCWTLQRTQRTPRRNKTAMRWRPGLWRRRSQNCSSPAFPCPMGPAGPARSGRMILPSFCAPPARCGVITPRRWRSRGWAGPRKRGETCLLPQRSQWPSPGFRS